MAVLSRRKFLGVAGIAVTASAAAACSRGAAPTATKAPEPTATAVAEATAAEEATAAPEATATPAAAETPVSKYNEAPMLAEKVAAGELPPVDERLPKEPLVVEPMEIGKYGGVWRQLHMGTVDRWQNSYLLREPLGRHTPDYGQIRPDLAKSWEWSDDGKTITFHLREGMKWSDGEPFTVDDIMFYYEDIVMNDELSPTKPSRLKRAGEVGLFEKVDDYTFRITFAEPYGAFEEFLPGLILWYPKHYLKEYHPNYVDQEELEAKVGESDFDTWVDLFNAKTEWFNNPGTPDILAWVPTNTVDQPVQVFERNPYYWKVDTAGNQLPYLDGIERTLLPDAEAILLKAIAGDADFQSRRVGGIANVPVVMENREKGDYQVFLTKNVGSNYGAIFFNYQHKDPVLKELFNNKDFRVALSIAIDRDEINALLFKGQATPGNVTASVDSPWYREELGKMYAEYDPDRANQILDDLGLTERDEEGFRLRPDGKRLSMVNQVFTPWPPENVDIQELVKGYWKAIGVEMIVKPTERQLWVAVNDSMDFDIMSYIANHGWPGNPPITRPMFAVNANEDWAVGWSLWIASEGKEGEEPPEEVKELAALYDRILGETDPEKRNEMYVEALRIQAENLWMIGVVGEPAIGRFGIIKNNVHNIPIDEPVGWEPTIVYTPAMIWKD